MRKRIEHDEAQKAKVPPIYRWHKLWNKDTKHYEVAARKVHADAYAEGDGDGADIIQQL